MTRARLPLDNNQVSIQVLAPVGPHERLDGSGTGATGSSNAYKSGDIVRLFTSDTDVYVSFVEGATAGDPTASSFPLASNSPEYFSINNDNVVISVTGGSVDINKCL